MTHGHNTVPAWDHETGGGMGLLSHLVHDHGANRTLLFYSTEGERHANHDKRHETDDTSQEVAS